MRLESERQYYFNVGQSANDIFENVNKKELELCAATIISIIYLILAYGL